MSKATQTITYEEALEDYRQQAESIDYGHILLPAALLVVFFIMKLTK